MTRATAALAVVALLGCFSKPPFDGVVADARLDDAIETVDDSSPDAQPFTHNVAFLTSTVTTVKTLGSIAAADALCNSLAMNAGLPANKYVAWLSSATETAAQRLGMARGWVRVDGRPFADTVAEIVGGMMYHPLRIDETGMDRGGVTVATATTENGALAAADCDGFTSTGIEEISVGVSDATKRRWTENGSVSCEANLRFYCLGTSFTTPLTITPAAGRIAFVSTSLFLPSIGPSRADSVCNTDAQNNSITGSFVALLATSTDSAASRLAITTEPWVRLDGIPLSLTKQDMVDGELLTSLNIDAGRQHLVDLQPWTGISAQTGLASAAGATCDDWKTGDVSSTGHVGTVVRTAANWYRSANAQSCAVAKRLYCFEQ